MDDRISRKGPSGPFGNLADDFSRSIVKTLGAPLTLVAAAGWTTILAVTISPLYGDSLCGNVYSSANVITGIAGVVQTRVRIGATIWSLTGITEAPAGVVAKAPIQYVSPYLATTSAPVVVTFEGLATTANGTISNAEIEFAAFGSWGYA